MVFQRPATWLSSYCSEVQGRRNEKWTPPPRGRGSSAYLPTTLANGVRVRRVSGSCWADYVKGETIGSGSYASVHLVEDANRIRRAAKLLDPTVFGVRSIEKVSEMSVKEICHLAECECPGVVRVVDVIEGSDGWLLVQELVDGGTLWRAAENGWWGETDAFVPFVQLLQSIYALQERGIVHRDLKPTNLLVSRKGEVYVADFGWSERLANLKASPNEWPGTLEINPPEVLRFRQPLMCEKIDNYGVGMNLWLFISGSFIQRADAASNTDAAASILLNTISNIRAGNGIAHGFGPESWSLFTALTEPDPRQRLSIAEAIYHPWVRSKIGALMMSQVDRKRLLRRAPGIEIQRLLWHGRVRSVASSFVAPLSSLSTADGGSSSQRGTTSGSLHDDWSDEDEIPFTDSAMKATRVAACTRNVWHGGRTPPPFAAGRWRWGWPRGRAEALTEDCPSATSNSRWPFSRPTIPERSDLDFNKPQIHPPVHIDDPKATFFQNRTVDVRQRLLASARRIR